MRNSLTPTSVLQLLSSRHEMMQPNHLLYTVYLYQLSPQAYAYTIRTNLLAYRSFPVTMNNLLKEYPCKARDTNKLGVDKVKGYSKED